MWVVMVIVMFGILYNFGKSADDAGIDVWNIIKHVLIFILAMLFLPLLIIFGRTKSKKNAP